MDTHYIGVIGLFLSFFFAKYCYRIFKQGWCYKRDFRTVDCNPATYWTEVVSAGVISFLFLVAGICSLVQLFI